MSAEDIEAALSGLVAAFEDLGIEYQVGGSVASSLHGLPRSTLDVDVVADLRPHHVGPLVRQLADEYYVAAEAVRDAIRRSASFNLIHQATVLKVDVFVLKARAFDQAAFRRGVVDTLPTSAVARSFVFETPEDVILHKLEWYRLGNELSERQWLDVLGVLKVQGAALDEDYMGRWAAQLGVADLLERALGEAGRG